MKIKIREQEREAMRAAHKVLCEILRYAELTETGKKQAREAAEKLYAALNGMPL